MRLASSFRRQIRCVWLGAKSASSLRGIALALAFLLAVVPALAEHTRWWRQDSFNDLDKGTAKGVALSSDGKLFLAPRFAEFADANLAYLLALRTDAKGNLYAAGGSNAKVLRYDAAGKATTVFESSELAAQAIAVDANGNLFVGTSPDGKVYKVTPAGQSSTFFDPKSKYIWDLAFGKDGTLYVATGDTGQIFSVAPDGKGQLFYSGEESNIRALAIDSNGNLLAGTEPGGLVLRITKASNASAQRNAKPEAASAGTPPGRAFVVYETGKQEITAMAQDAGGNLYVAAVGERGGALQGQSAQSTEASTTSGFTITVGPQGATTAPSQQIQNTPFTPFPAMNSSSVFRIAPDGSPEELWSSKNDLVYALGFLPNGKLVLGAGNEGTVTELDGNHIFSRLVKTSSAQVTSFVAGPAGKVYFAAGNPGKIFSLGPDSEPEGSFESQPYDAQIFSRWGRLEWSSSDTGPIGNARPPRIEFYARSGNTSDPNNNWSPWAGPYVDPANNKVECPAARFIQWKAVLRATTNGPVPDLEWVSVAYLPKNVSPEITGIAVQAPGIRTQPVTAISTSQPSAQIRMPQAESSGSSFSSAFNSSTNFNSSHFDVVPQGFVQKGYQSVVWTASDANDDPLVFAIYYRGENEKDWKLLKDNLTEHFYSWDTTGMPDGAYYLKITASDAPGNPPGEQLTAERTSDRFEVDNTPPAIAQLTAETLANAKGLASVRVRFQASDPASPIMRAQYSLDAGDWTLVFPTGGLSDRPKEDYDFKVENVTPGEHTVTVRVYDEFENVSSAKTTVRIPTSGN